MLTKSFRTDFSSFTVKNGRTHASTSLQMKRIKLKRLDCSADMTILTTGKKIVLKELFAYRSAAERGRFLILLEVLRANLFVEKATSLSCGSLRNIKLCLDQTCKYPPPPSFSKQLEMQRSATRVKTNTRSEGTVSLASRIKVSLLLSALTIFGTRAREQRLR